MQKTKRKGKGKNMACLNKKQNASKTILKQRPTRPEITFEDGFANLVESCESSSSKLTKQIESELSERVVSLASFTGSIHPEDECGNLVKSCESSSSELTKKIESQLSESVVALGSCVGDTVVFECTGIIIENLCADATSILTSANIAGSSDYGITDNLTIKVCLPSGKVVIGWLHHRDSKYDLAVVNIKRVRDFQEVHLSSSHRVQFETKSKVVAVGRCFHYGKLQSIDGIVIGCANDETCEFMLPRCRIITAWIGCPLVDLDGNFVGLNLQYGERTAFLPVKKILECVRYPGTNRHSAADTKDNRVSKSWSPIYVNRMSEDVVEPVTFDREEDVYGRVIWC